MRMFPESLGTVSVMFTQSFPSASNESVSFFSKTLVPLKYNISFLMVVLSVISMVSLSGSVFFEVLSWHELKIIIPNKLVNRFFIISGFKGNKNSTSKVEIKCSYLTRSTTFFSKKYFLNHLFYVDFLVYL